jgi:hypothetical protein
MRNPKVLCAITENATDFRWGVLSVLLLEEFEK